MKRTLSFAAFFRTIFSILLLVRLTNPAHAQADSSDDTKTKLKIIVHLPQGATTLEQLTDTLSKQTGLTIEPIEYLKQHRLIVSMDNLSAASALDAVAEMNEWVLQENSAGHVLITRKRAKSAETFAEVAAALKAALPKDFRRFTGVEGSALPIDPSTFASRPNEKRSRELFRNANFLDLQEIFADRGRAIYLSLLPDVLDNKRHKTISMTPNQQSPLITILVLEGFQFIFTPMNQSFMEGEVRPYESAADTCIIAVDKENSMVIGSGGRVGSQQRFYVFAAPLTYHYEPAPKR